jgi:23S rRNA pseudouridine1911/1915/1917 synthase
MIKDETKNKSFIQSGPSQKAKKAELYYKHIASSDQYHLLEIILMTGRHHQIRAQLAKMGCPIKGDVKYGFNRPNPDLSIHLHARHIEFVHPVTGEKLMLSAKPPSDPLWDYFIQGNVG